MNEDKFNKRQMLGHVGDFSQLFGIKDCEKEGELFSTHGRRRICDGNGTL